MTRAPLPDYPWDSLRPYAQKSAEHPLGVVDLSVGSPIDPTPAIIADALKHATEAHEYPATAGSPALRQAIVDWYQRRRGVTLESANVLPTIGSKELVALLPFLLGLGEGDAVVYPVVAYPSYAIGAALVSAEAVAEDNPEKWPANTKLVWLNSPANPTGEVLSTQQLGRAVARARELGALIVNDECYAELGWDAPWNEAPTPCILHPDVIGADHSSVLSVYSLSKQSNLAGYRAAFIAGDAEVIAQLLKVRKHAGLMQPEPVQTAMTVALADDAHVSEQRERYRRRRAVLLPALQSAGFEVQHSEAGLYLWATRGENCWQSVDFMAELGILVGPGEFYGDSSSEFIRLSLTATDERIDSAAQRLASQR